MANIRSLKRPRPNVLSLWQNTVWLWPEGRTRRRRIHPRRAADALLDEVMKEHGWKPSQLDAVAVRRTWFIHGTAHWRGHCQRALPRLERSFDRFGHDAVARGPRRTSGPHPAAARRHGRRPPHGSVHRDVRCLGGVSSPCATRGGGSAA